jgi:hypothetical protein
MKGVASTRRRPQEGPVFVVVRTAIASVVILTPGFSMVRPRLAE